jgi:hypothetical protein
LVETPPLLKDEWRFGRRINDQDETILLKHVYSVITNGMAEGVWPYLLPCSDWQKKVICALRFINSFETLLPDTSLQGFFCSLCPNSL